MLRRYRRLHEPLGAIAGRGRIGAEELTDVMSRAFGSMLDLAYAPGGALVKFVGDALLLLFTGDEHAMQAVSAAVEMRAALRESRSWRTSVGRLDLGMSIGIHSASSICSTSVTRIAS